MFKRIVEVTVNAATLKECLIGPPITTSELGDLT